MSAERRVALLVHGAFRGGWAWDRVTPLLRAAGLEVHAPSLPGCGERYRGSVSISLHEWIDDLRELVLTRDWRDLVLVGHSQGALVAAGLAAALPDRIGVLLHLDGAVADPGERAFDLGGGTLSEPPARDLWIPPVPAQVGPEVDAELADWMNQRLTPTPVGPSLDVVPTVPGSVRQEFVFATGTPQGYPSALSRRRRHERGLASTEVECGHDIPLVAPHVAAQVILAAAGWQGAVRSDVDTSGS